MKSSGLAQVGVLLHEADRDQHVRQERLHANNTARPLIEKERLFRHIQYRQYRQARRYR
jgi:hypothetical protein